MKINTLRDLFEIELLYAYDCEQKLAEYGLPDMIDGCSSPELRDALVHHLTETQRHIARLEQICASAGIEPDRKANDILKQIMSAANDSVDHIEPSSLRDAALITNGNQVEHYEIALYGSLAALARELGFQNAVSTLEETLAEEKAADAKLTQIAESQINAGAARESLSAGTWTSGRPG